ncbi:MAG: gluconate 2-dehydrogenase subunit 3 family protein [Cyclobacteriaceae bacterium]
MKRRKILKGLAMVSGGIVLLPSFNPVTEKKVKEAYQNLNISKDDHEMMGNLCDTIIPPDQNFKGAKELGVHGFVLLMVNDCLAEEEKKNFLMGWQDFKKYIKKNMDTPSIDQNKEKWEEMVLGILQGNSEGVNHGNVKGLSMEKVDYFLKSVKQFSILGYTHSEYYMTSIMSYKMVPGKFKGSIPIKEQEKVNLYG